MQICVPLYAISKCSHFNLYSRLGEKESNRRFRFFFLNRGAAPILVTTGDIHLSISLGGYVVANLDS